ncbi:hypothetical protein AB6A40_003473 [Gnathostoma spinigerum]|uniref:Uncharacterized protein n=1 Tax=Gnathostoma spinigerum TaxID=75299 RepID=A0ABD6EF70_9BILA
MDEVFADRLNGIKIAIERLDEEIKKKEKILADSVEAMRRLPQSIASGASLANIMDLNSSNATCEDVFIKIAFVALFSDYLCVAFDVENKSDYNGVPLCSLFFPDCFSTSSSSTAVIFDRMEPVMYSASRSVRRVMLSCSKNYLLGTKAICIVNWHFVKHDDLLPTLQVMEEAVIGRERSDLQLKFLIEKPDKICCLEKVAELSVEEGIDLYQCLYTSFCSSTIRTGICNINNFLNESTSFRSYDFGEWQMNVGIKESVWADVVLVEFRGLQDSEHIIRVFAKTDEAVLRLVERLSTVSKIS